MSYYGGYFGGRPTGGTLSTARHRKREREDPYALDEFSAPAKYTRAMPYRRMRSRRRRTGRRRRGLIRKRIPRALVPRSKLARLKVCNTVSLGATGNLDGGTIQINSFDDPFASDAALQVLGYDQYKALYRKATVVGIKVKQEVYNSGSVPIMAGINAMPENQGTTLLTQAEHYAELPNHVHRVFSPDIDHGVMFMTASVKKHFGVSQLRDNDELTMVVPTETPPTRIAYMHFYAQVLDQSSVWTATFVHTVEYIVLFHDPVVPARSLDT